MIPLTVLKRGEGPTALLTGANHGDEYEGPVALFKLAGTLRAEEVTGRVVIVPAMNYPAFRAGRRTSPIDQGNLNRAFPGRTVLAEAGADMILIESMSAIFQLLPAVEAANPSPPAAISATLPALRAAFDGSIGAYANIGYRRGPEPPRYPERQYHVIEIGENTPERYAAYAREWLAMGAQIVGGCCATKPDHIAAMAPVVQRAKGEPA